MMSVSKRRQGVKLVHLASCYLQSRGAYFQLACTQQLFVFCLSLPKLLI